MYPIIRVCKEIIRAKILPKRLPTDSYSTHHICWPWDIDIWIEMNNGRILTIFDLCRIGMVVNSGMTKILRDKRWGFTVAGTSVRYRKRIRLFDRFEARVRFVGHDGRFLYLEHSMWRKGQPLVNALLRSAVVERDEEGHNRLVEVDRFTNALGLSKIDAGLPDWVKAWIEAEGQRPWPPEL